MVSRMVIVSHEGCDLAFEIAGQVVVLEQDAVLKRLMPALDFALGLRMVGRSADMLLAFDADMKMRTFVLNAFKDKGPDFQPDIALRKGTAMIGPRL